MITKSGFSVECDGILLTDDHESINRTSQEQQDGSDKISVPYTTIAYTTRDGVVVECHSRVYPRSSLVERWVSVINRSSRASCNHIPYPMALHYPCFGDSYHYWRPHCRNLEAPQGSRQVRQDESSAGDCWTGRSHPWASAALVGTFLV